MKQSQMYIAIGVVAILLVAGAAGAILLTGDEEEKIDKVYHEYDMTKGWGSWDPILGTTSSSALAGSAYVAQVAKSWYNIIYGEPVPTGKYTIKDVPKDFLTYESLVSHNADGKLVVKSMATDASEKYVPKDMVFNGVPDYIICAGSFACTVYTILAAANGTEYDDYDDQVLTQLFDKIIGGDRGVAENFESYYGIPNDKWHGTQFRSCTNIMKYQEQYMELFGKIKDEGKTVCFLGSGGMGWNNGGDWLVDRTAEMDSYSALFNYRNITNILADIEAIAYILGYGDVAEDIVDDIRLGLYTVSECCEKNESKYDYTRSMMYINVDKNNARGPGSLADELMGLMHFDNTAKHEGNQEISEEDVIKVQPEVIIFVSNDKLEDLDLDQALRVKHS